MEKDLDLTIDDVTLRGNNITVQFYVTVEGKDEWMEAEATFYPELVRYDADYQPAEPDVGIMHSYVEVELTNISEAIDVEEIYPIDKDGNFDKSRKELPEKIKGLKSKLKSAIENKLWKNYYDEIHDSVEEEIKWGNN
jgi:hypothetical protein